MLPLIGAIASGCTAVVKPSEMTPHSAALCQEILAKCLDPDCYTVVLGGIPESTKLLELRWDKICYTGNATVAKIISAAAAKYLTPVLLELYVSWPILL
jgi:acyl-CoA reductase-like NAD-dependent aldehyde dehydrogenase